MKAPRISGRGRRPVAAIVTPVLAATLLGAALLTSCASKPAAQDDSPGAMKTVERVELDRYMGDWYVIANIPNRSEKNCVDSLERYALRPDGRIDNTFDCRDGSFDKPMERRLDTIAWVYDPSTNAEWRVRFFKVIPVKYLVIDLDPAYQWAVVGHPSREYGWVLARTKTLPTEVYSGILGRLKQQGYDVSKFARVPQKS
jgi:apolipoprotein D and lipocalin family protein